MIPFSYKNRLQRDLKRWVERGWVSETSRDVILNELGQGRQERDQPSSIAFGAGVVLILIGVLAFVSSNWDELSHVFRLLILFGAMAALYVAGVTAIHVQTRPWIPENLFLLAAGIFGANVFLIAQMYNIASDDISAAVMLWCVGCLVTAWGTRSVTTLHVVFTLLFVWTAVKGPGTFPLGVNAGPAAFEASLLIFLLPWSAAVVTAARWNWKPVLHLAAVTFVFFILTLVTSMTNLPPAEQTALFTIIFLVLFTAGRAITTASPSITARHEWLTQKTYAVERYTLTSAVFGFTILYAAASTGEPTGDFTNPARVTLLAGGSIVVLSIVFLRVKQHLAIRDAIAVVALLIGVLFQPYVTAIDQDALFFWLHAGYALILILWLVDFGLRGDHYWRRLGYLLFAVHLLHLYARAFGSLLETSLFLILGGMILLATAFAMHRFNLWAVTRIGDHAT